MPGFNVSGIGEGPSGQPEAYLTYTWEIEQLYGQGIGQDSALIRLRDVTLPTVNIGRSKVKGASLNYKFAQDVDWDDVRVVWYDTRGLLKIIKKWREDVWTEKDGLRPPSEYKKPSRIRTLLPNGDAANYWHLVNSWPSVIRYGDLTYTQSDLKIVELMLTYDWAREIDSDDTSKPLGAPGA